MRMVGGWSVEDGRERLLSSGRSRLVAGVEKVAVVGFVVFGIGGEGQEAPAGGLRWTRDVGDKLGREMVG